MRLPFYILLCATQWLFAQIDSDIVPVQINLPEIALLDIEDGSPVVLNQINPTEAGEQPTFESDSGHWINFTSAVSTGTTRNITAVIDGGSISPGITLQLTLSGYSGTGSGDLGTAAGGPIALTTTPQVIVTGIGGAYTGNGTGNGYQISYTISLSDISLLTSTTSANFDVVYTIMTSL